MLRSHEAPELTLHPQGTVIAVRAQAGARTTTVRGVQAGALKISVTQVPEKGKANKVLAEVLADALKVSKSRVQLIDGEASPRKRFLVVGLSPDEVAARLRSAVGDQ